MEGSKILVAPLIGAVIGYCTNYIAVKMLFSPLKPVKIGNATLPFTPGIIVNEGSAAVKNMGGMISMFINYGVIASFAEPIGAKVEEYINNYGKELIKFKVKEEISTFEVKPIKELFSMDNTEALSTVIGEIYEKFLDKEIADIVKVFDICTIVEKKINDMDVVELEKLIMSVMKNELGEVINL